MYTRPKRSFKKWWFWYTPQTPNYDTNWSKGLWYRLRHYQYRLPLGQLFCFYWWRRTIQDIKRGKCNTCQACQRSWFRIHILAAVVGERFMPPCGR